MPTVHIHLAVEEILRDIQTKTNDKGPASKVSSKMPP